ncbi:hypothetical protein [Neorhizobium alkalisoli]|nr:hypothetical protein [Neorhizobium alkalisoli]
MTDGSGDLDNFVIEADLAKRLLRDLVTTEPAPRGRLIHLPDCGDVRH